MNYGVYPIRPWNAFYLTASGYLSKSYYQSFGKWHRGEDINKITGGDTDLGYPVQNMFPGTVLYADAPENSNWGNIVLVRTEDWLKKRIEARLQIPMEVLDIQYAHLQHLTVTEGMVLNPGDHIGSVGKGGNNQFIAHLHLEARRKPMTAFHPQGKTTEDLLFTQEHTLDPKLILTLPLGEFSDMIPTKRHELSGGTLYVNDATDASKKLIRINRVNEKIFIKNVV